MGEDQAQARAGVGEHAPVAAAGEAEVDQDGQPQLLAARRDRQRVLDRPAVPVGVELDPDEAGDVAPALELVDADRGPAD